MSKKKKEEKKEERASEQQVDAFADDLPEEFRDTWERMPEDVKEYFVKAAAESRTSAEFVARIMVGSCPRCGSSKTASGEDVEEIKDPTIGMCKECGCTWCLECELPVLLGSECVHWQVCRECNEPKDENGDCGRLPSECEPMKKWLEEKKLQVPKFACAWCGHEIPEEQEHFVLGARVIKSSYLPAREGAIVELSLPGQRTVPAIATTESSQARQEGKDLVFVTCCEECAESLSAALKQAGEAFEILL